MTSPGRSVSSSGDVDGRRVGYIALPEPEHAEGMALNLELRLVERDRHCWVLEQLVREESVPDLHPVGRRLLCQHRHELGQRDGARVREPVKDGVEPEEVIPVRVGDVDLRQVLSGRRQPVGKFLRLALGHERIYE